MIVPIAGDAAPQAAGAQALCSSKASVPAVDCAARAAHSRDNHAFVTHRPPASPMINFVVQGVAAFIALALYFLPSIVADRRKRHDLLTIALFNAVVGWTVFGWLLALYWALQPNPPENVAGDIAQSRNLVRMRKFSVMLTERV